MHSTNSSKRGMVQDRNAAAADDDDDVDKEEEEDVVDRNYHQSYTWEQAKHHSISMLTGSPAFLLFVSYSVGNNDDCVVCRNVHSRMNSMLYGMMMMPLQQQPLTQTTKS